ncbi:SsgA family sporulation/cell division regulator [Streptomyces sp. NPDC051453]|uniref:SsgA family sporulation/cell division regulator n=1 Tax=Streptomyces sp. NPDC051453 TaxID=3154941 RepID=UPI003444F259
MVSRELLSAGLTTDAGMGEVTVKPQAHKGERLDVAVKVTQEWGMTHLVIDHSALLPYLERTHALLPFGGEETCLDMDAALGEILDEG